MLKWPRLSAKIGENSFVRWQYGVSKMTLTENGLSELVPVLRALSRADKLRLIQHLVAELAREEGIALGETATPYPVWTPHHAFDAAAVLLKALEAEEGAP
jgi:hypothetical protein